MASDSSSLIIEKRSERVFSLNGGEPYVKVCNFIKPCGVSNNNNNEKVISPAPVLPKPTSNSKLEALYAKVKFKGRHSSPEEKWKTWVLSLHSKHHLTWKQAGIEKPILSSLHKIVKQNDVILKVADRWCPDTNTFIFPCGESTLTLEDMLVLGGFSVLGHSVSTARILDDDDVLLMIRENALIKALKTLIRTSGKRYCGNYTWMEHFMGTGKELEHEAFLVFWLLRFVFPKDAIRRDIFPIAIRLSKGHRLALGPAVLASIYRDLRQLKHYILSNKNGFRSNSKPLYLWAPLQLVQLWVWERFPTLSPKPCSIKPSEPRVARWVFIHKLKVKQAGLSINNVGGEFSWRPYTAVTFNKNNTIGNASNIPSPPLTAENDIHIKTTLMVKVTEMNTQLPEFAREEMEKNMEDRNLSNVQSFIGESEKAKEVGVDINPSSTMKNTEKSTDAEDPPMQMLESIKSHKLPDFSPNCSNERRKSGPADVEMSNFEDTCEILSRMQENEGFTIEKKSDSMESCQYIKTLSNTLVNDSNNDLASQAPGPSSPANWLGAEVIMHLLYLDSLFFARNGLPLSTIPNRNNQMVIAKTEQKFERRVSPRIQEMQRLLLAKDNRVDVKEGKSKTKRSKSTLPLTAFEKGKYKMDHRNTLKVEIETEADSDDCNDDDYGREGKSNKRSCQALTAFEKGKCNMFLGNSSGKDEVEVNGVAGDGEGSDKSAHMLVKETLRLFNKYYLYFVPIEEERCKNSQNTPQRPDMRTLTEMQARNEVIYSEKRIGQIPGIDVGHQFYSRAEMFVVGLHCQTQNGIDTMRINSGKVHMKVAVSIVMSGQYQGDLDKADEIIYSGQGGHNLLGNKSQIKDQKMERGTLALKNCIEAALPVRVTRGHKSNNSYTPMLYTYDGLYNVIEYWKEKVDPGFEVYKFRLRRCQRQPPLTTSQVQFIRGRVPKSSLSRVVCNDISGGQENFLIPATTAVFRTLSKGWGVRSPDFIPSGAPVCEYTGKLMRTKDLDNVSDNNYIFEIDCLQTMKGIGGREKRLRDVSIPSIHKLDDQRSDNGPEFCIDAGVLGNVARFINHSCEPNLFVQCVLDSHHDPRLAKIMLFAADNISPLQELTYDYGYPLDSLHDPDGKIIQVPCYCGTADCRKRLL
ncbi:hypothetical protein ACFE04_022099 [Oxalis oulophora]